MAKPKLSGPTAVNRRSNPARLYKTLIFDNGAHSIKAGFASDSPSYNDCHIIPNCVARSQRDKLTYIGAELDDCKDFGELLIRRPVEQGFIVNWESQKAIWERTILDERSPLFCDPSETNLILTEAPHAPQTLRRYADEIVFEEFEFASMYRTLGATLNAYSPPTAWQSTPPSTPPTPSECLLLIDAGHSHTTVTPLYHGRPLHSACRRLDIGGKTLTARLKQLLSRTMDMSREDWLAGEIKEDVCYVAGSTGEFAALMERCWKGGVGDRMEVDESVVVDYVLPDYERLVRGFARPHDASRGARMRRLGVGVEGGGSEMVVPVGNERFAVPELIFTPGDLGLRQEGVVGMVMQSLGVLPKGLWQGFLANVMVVGGTSRLPGFVQRLEDDLRARLDEGYFVRVAAADDPVKNTWSGGARLAHNEALFRKVLVTKQEYAEHGDLWARRKFAGKVTS